MTPKELRSRRQALGLSGAELSRRLGVSRQQVSAWHVGRYPVPAYVSAYLDALDEIARLTAERLDAEIAGHGPRARAA